MFHGLYEALSGAVGQETKLDIITNNLANAGTPGYKRDFVPFQTELHRAVKTGQAGPADRRYADPEGSHTDFSPGSVVSTGNPLDVALLGDGFLVVQSPGGVRFTRQGNLKLDTEGNLVTSGGLAVLGGGGPINLQEAIDNGLPIQIDASGAVTAGQTQVDTLRIAKPAKTKDLLKEGGNLFTVRPGAPAPADTEGTVVQQGAIEQGNVNMVSEMTGLIEANRIFEAYQRVIQAVDEATGKATNEIGRVA